jgi:GNAT superfamily N-acetyltransferase
MKIHALREAPSPAMAAGLREFEARFSYPLGPGRSFRISHGDDYPRFFRAMGPATCFIAERDGRVIGALGVAMRPILLPDGNQMQVAYIGDLKVDPAVRGVPVFLRLAQAALAWCRPRVTAAYGVMMDGTRVTPASYTGRVGIPSFMELGRILVVRFATFDDAPAADFTRWIAPSEKGEQRYRALSRGRFASIEGTPADRSILAPQWLVHPDGLACGRMEDTRAGKKLIHSDGNEMISAHLACAAWQTPGGGAELIHAACRLAAEAGMPLLFVSICPEDIGPLDAAIGPTERVIAPATIFGVGLPNGSPWHINTSEI